MLSKQNKGIFNYLEQQCSETPQEYQKFRDIRNKVAIYSH